MLWSFFFDEPAALAHEAAGASEARLYISEQVKVQPFAQLASY
jgi:hypothetical protein